jgi:CheY-like chemotaxis protein
MRALIVERNHTSRAVLQYYLTTWGLQVEAVEEASRIVESLKQAAWRSEPYQLMIIDAQMPQVEIETLTDAIRSDETIAATRIIVMTPLNARDDAAKTRHKGNTIILSKPVHRSALYYSIIRATTLALAVQSQTEATVSHPVSVKLHGRILLAEDNLVNQMVAVEMLEGMGCRVTVADNGQAAVEAVANDCFDLILMDCHMPTLDGFEATKAIRERELETETTRDTAPPLSKKVPIIALTANALEGDRERCLTVGMDDYLSKPFTQGELYSTLGRWLTAS